MARKLCTACNARPAGAGKGDDAAYAKEMELCNPCATEGGWENTHSDYDHVGIAKVVQSHGIEWLNEHDKAEYEYSKGCWICHPELNEAAKPYVKQERQGHHSPRRKQLNHRFCRHAQVPKERRDCRNAFWASGAEDFGLWCNEQWTEAGYVVQDGHWVLASMVDITRCELCGSPADNEMGEFWDKKKNTSVVAHGQCGIDAGLELA